MWQLVKISANNICAFKEFAYELTLGRTTLVFGNNMDNDAQGSNGSGKSALIECIALAITGEPLRNVKNDEIINDAANEAEVRASFHNEAESTSMVVTRQFSRKNPQVIQITVKDYGEEEQPIVCSSVAEYNKKVLDILGITKEDVFANYILSKSKYQSFLMSSDREKKEIINRFSNGDMVDESIEALHADMEPRVKELEEQTYAVNQCNGSVLAIKEQLENAAASKEERRIARLKKIEDWEHQITEHRSTIRTLNANSTKLEERIDKFCKFSEKLGEMEGGDDALVDAYKIVSVGFDELEITGLNNYAVKAENLLAEVRVKNQDKASQETKLQEAKNYASALQAELTAMKQKHIADAAADKATYEQNARIIADLEASQKELAEKINQAETKLRECNAHIQHLETRLAGKIQCPKCGHEFVIASDKSIANMEQELKDAKQLASEVRSESEAHSAKQESQRQTKDKLVEDNSAIRTRMVRWRNDESDLETKVNVANNNVQTITHAIESCQTRLGFLQDSVNGLKKAMFDEAFNILESNINAMDRQIKRNDNEVKDFEGTIQRISASIEETSKASDDELETSLKQSLEKYEAAYNEAEAVRKQKESIVSQYKAQEAMFTEFKTYLANTKIQALNDITNEFLQAIGSDIRISLSGYTVLKSGKIRDKISISLLRDGIDCGSFDKFSAGEQCRVNLANILAMHKLTNANCTEGLGLDLLVIDEILDATDEAGLASIFDALNNLHVTTMVVSHGNIAESYPYRLIVNKHNGISYI